LRTFVKADKCTLDESLIDQRNLIVEESLAHASRKLDEITARREKLIKESRDVISYCAKAIVNIHTSNFEEASKLKKKAKQKLDELRAVAGADLARYILTPEQEFVECSAMFSVASKQKIPSLENLGVAPSSYVLGLLDTVGELKRSVYDKIREDDAKSAEAMFATMESLYTMISPFAAYDNIVQGVKRKLDVARILIDDTRATITEEVRRAKFMETVNDLASAIGATPLFDKKLQRAHQRTFDIKRNEEGSEPA
jgi:translin